MNTINLDKKYNIYTSIILIMKILPVQMGCLLFYTIIMALIPTWQTLATAIFIDTTIDIFYGMGEKNTIHFAIFVILVCILLENIMPTILNFFYVTGRNKLNKALKVPVLKKQASLNYCYIENQETCKLVNRVCTDVVERFEEGWKNLFQAIELIIKVSSLFLIILNSSWISGVIIAIVTIPLFSMSIKTGEKNYKLEKDVLDIKRRYNYLVEVLSSREYAKERNLFGYSAFVKEKYERLFSASYKKEKQIEIKRYANMKSGSIIMVGIALVILFILLPGLLKKKMTEGLYIALAGAILGLVQSMSWSLSSIMQQYARFKSYLKEFNLFLNLDEKKDAIVEPIKIEGFQLDTIEFKHVSFRYPGMEKYVLKDCSFQLESNQCYAFVGRNGAGKTTITKLLTGMYDCFEGEILINGKSIREYPYAQLKGLISVVFQDFAKYELDIKENIILGNRNFFNEKKLEEICRKIGIEDWIKELPNGIDNKLGKLEEGSVDLSGGQWQKLAIARLLYIDAPINILDEPTASLDPIAEAKIYDSFRIVNKTRFTIYITHRLGAARIANKILVLDNGYIVEQGSHNELMEVKNGLYKEMFESQRKWYEV